jgi:predicted lipoprotein with Yx(FWY)xxD motif
MRRLLPLVLAVGLIAGCGSDSESDEDKAAAPKPAETETTTTEKSKPAATKGTTIKLAGSQFGQILFDGRGQAIYLFDKEKSDRSECYDACAAAWPPVLTDGEPQAASGVEQSLLGTTKRSDGKTQVTYDGHPLYFYAHEGRNEVKCHNVNEFGGLWLVLNARGDVPS